MRDLDSGERIYLEETNGSLTQLAAVQVAMAVEHAHTV